MRSSGGSVAEGLAFQRLNDMLGYDPLVDTEGTGGASTDGELELSDADGMSPSQEFAIET